MAVESPSRPKRLTREETKAQTRALLLEAAGRMFARLGYEAATLEEIAAEAGFTKGAMYFHFPGKDALFIELLDTGLRRHINELNGLMAFADGGTDTFEQAFRQWLDGLLDEGADLGLLGLEVQLASRRNSTVAPRFSETVAQYQQALTAFLDKYFKVTGRKPAVPIEILPATLVAMLEGLALTRQSQGRDAVATPAQMIRLLIGDPG